MDASPFSLKPKRRRWLAALSAEGLHPRLYHNAQKTEFGFAEGGAREIDIRF